MSDAVTRMIAFLDPRARGQIKGSARIVLPGEGSLILTEEGARAGDDSADVTLTASEDTFRAIAEGTQNPVTAFMTGKLKVDGSTTRALKVSAVLTG